MLKPFSPLKLMALAAQVEGAQRPLALFGGGVAADDHDAAVPGHPVGAQPPAGFDPAALAQVAVQHHQGRPADLGQGHRPVFRLLLVHEVAVTFVMEGVPEQPAHVRVA